MDQQSKTVFISRSTPLVMTNEEIGNLKTKMQNMCNDLTLLKELITSNFQRK
jgi:hypothetical protein